MYLSDRSIRVFIMLMSGFALAVAIVIIAILTEKQSSMAKVKKSPSIEPEAIDPSLVKRIQQLEREKEAKINSTAPWHTIHVHRHHTHLRNNHHALIKKN